MTKTQALLFPGVKLATLPYDLTRKLPTCGFSTELTRAWQILPHGLKACRKPSLS